MKKLISLTKPGIIFGNVITVTAGFFVGSQKSPPHLGIFLATLLGISLVMACGCVLNNFIDRDIDKLMERTKRRLSAQENLPTRTILGFAFILGVIGTLLLALFTNLLTLIIALVGLFFYVVVYTCWFKRTSVYGTLIGSISGAVPPVIGYTAASNRFDMGAIILFAILGLWQMPHAYAIAIYRLRDYQAANIPVLPVVKGILRTKISMMLYVIPFGMATCMLSLYGYTGRLTFWVALALSLGWFALSVGGFFTQNDTRWAKKMFLFSVILIVILSVTMSVNPG